MTETKTKVSNLFVEYIRDILPKELGAKTPESAGVAAETIFIEEMAGKPAFSEEKFATVRDRAEMCIPYQVPRDNLGKREHALDVIELCFLKHAAREHGVDHSERIAALSDMPMTETESKIVAMDFWSGA